MSVINGLSFIATMNRAIYEQDMSNLKISSGIKVDNTIPNFIGINLSIPYKYLDDSMTNFVNLTSHEQDAVLFYERIYNSPRIEDVPSQVSVYDINEVKKIKPQYIKQFINNASDYIEKAINGNITTDTTIKIGSPEYIRNIKKQMVVAKFPDTIDDKKLVKLDSSLMTIKVDSNFIATTILPYMRGIEHLKEDLRQIISDIKENERYAVKTLNAYTETINNLRKSGKIPEESMDTISYVLSIITHNLLELVKYVVAVTIRKINICMHNTTEYLKLKDTLLRYFPAGALQMHESTLDGDFDFRDEEIVYELLNGSDNIFDPIIDKVYNRYKSFITQTGDKRLGDDFHSIIDTSIKSNDYNSEPYIQVKVAIKEINEAIKKYARLVQNPDYSIEEINELSGLNRDLFIKPELTSGIEDIDFYTDSKLSDGMINYDLVMSELINGELKLQQISKAISIVYNKIKSLRADVKENVNNKYQNHERNNEVVDYLRNVEKDYRQLILTIGRSFINRLYYLDNELNSVDNSVTDPNYGEITSGIDYNETVFESIIDEDKALFEMQNKLFFEDVHNRYMNNKYGIVFEDAPTDNQQNNANTQQNQNNQNNNDNSKPKVVDNSNNANNTQNQNDTSQNGTQGKQVTDAVANNIKDAVKEFFTNLKNKISQAMKKNNLKVTNTNFISEHKDYLLNTKQYQSISITARKFNEKNPFDVANSQIQSLSSLNLSSLNETSLKTTIFKFMNDTNIDKKEINDIGTELTTFFKYGSITVPDEQSFSGSECKTYVTNAVTFCENYYNMIDNLNVFDTAEKTITSITDSASKDSNSNDKLVRDAQRYIQLIVTSACNASRDLSTDYMHVINSLVPKKRIEEANKNKEVNNQTTPENQNNNNQENQNNSNQNNNQ